MSSRHKCTCKNERELENIALHLLLNGHARVTRGHWEQKTRVLTHFVSISRIYTMYLKKSFQYPSFTLKLISINTFQSCSINKSRTFNFKYFQGLGIGLLKFKDFQWFSRCVRTLGLTWTCRHHVHISTLVCACDCKWSPAEVPVDLNSR